MIVSAHILWAKPRKVEGLVALRHQIAEFHCIINCVLHLSCIVLISPPPPHPSLPFTCKCVLWFISRDLIGLCDGDGGGCRSLAAMDRILLFVSYALGSVIL